MRAGALAFSPHTLVQFGGIYSGSDMANESWSCTIRGFVGAGGGQLTNPQGYADAIATPLNSWWVLAGNNMRNDARLSYVKVNNINAAGHYVGPTTNIHIFGSPQLGGATPSGPAFVCLAYTWETGITLGKAKRGRMYPPNTYAVAAGTGESVTASNANLAVTSAKALLTLLNVVDPGTSNKFTPAVMNRSDAKFNAITGVSVNYVLDVQRRRKKQALNVRTPVTVFP